MQYYSITDTLNWWDIQRGGGREVKGVQREKSTVGRGVCLMLCLLPLHLFCDCGGV